MLQHPRGNARGAAAFLPESNLLLSSDRLVSPEDRSIALSLSKSLLLAVGQSGNFHPTTGGVIDVHHAANHVLGHQAVGIPRSRARIRGGSRRCLRMSLGDLVRKNVPAASNIEAVASPEDSTKHPEDHRRRPWKRPQQSLTAFEGNDAGESPRQAHVSLWFRGCAARHIRTRWKGGLFGPFTGVPSPAPFKPK